MAKEDKMKDLLIRRNGAFILLMINTLLAFIGMGLVIPVMPSYINMMGISGTTAGFLVATYALTELIFSPYAGSLSDRYGRKQFIVVGMILFTISELVFGLANNTFLLFIGRAIGGIGAGLIMPAIMAYVVDITNEKDRGLGMGWISAAITTGFIIGPGIGGFLAEYGIRIPFYAAAGAGILATLATIVILPESLDEQKRIEIREKSDIQKENLFAVLLISYKTPYFHGLSILMIASLGLALYETVMGLFVDQKLDYTARDISIVITIGAVVAAALQLTLFNKMVNWLGEKKLVIWCMLLASISIFLTILFENFWLIIILVTFIFTGIELVRPSISTYFSKIAGDDQGYIAGMNASFTSVGYIIGPSIAGILFDFNLNLPFIVGSLIMLMGTWISVRWVNSQRSKDA